jgi:hypothetical protein
MQLRFTPEKKRRKQLDAAEELFAIVDKDKEYPFEFVFFRITGFNLKSLDQNELIRGDELLEDLRIFISKLGGKLARPVAEQGEKIHTVRELAEAVGVSTKTIYRVLVLSSQRSINSSRQIRNSSAGPKILRG